MTRLIDLDTLVGEDIEVKLAGETYLLPSDIPAESMVRLISLYQRAGEGEEDDNVATLEAISDEVLTLFQIRQPDLEYIPIGIKGAFALLTKLMDLYNDAPEGEPDAAPLDRPAPKKAPRSSNGSSRSNKRPAGGRTNGARSAGAS